MVHGDRAVGLLYGQRALLIGALEPLTYTGTMLGTRAADRPFRRLTRTAKIQETVFLGTRAEADKALAGVHRLHETIEGRLPEAAGVHPAGTRYSAFDPELMLWTLAVIADSGRAMYETMVRPLSDEERECLWQDYILFGELFRLPRSEVPGSYREFEAWFNGKLESPDLHATEHALEMAPLVAFRQPVPAPARGNIAIQNHMVKGDPSPPGPRDLRDRLEQRPRGILPGDHRGSPPCPPPAAPHHAARSKRHLLRCRQSRRAAARRHPYPSVADRLSAIRAPGRGAGTSPTGRCRL
jgi:hypothetical protein